ncbi:hypothetical protein B1B08_06270 [Cutibacterium acnes subsp. defendens]|nr:hypothetical protein B1B08_06270 [Cutibacterium acnes subsp. defendens]
MIMPARNLPSRWTEARAPCPCRFLWIVVSGSDIGTPVCSAADHWQDPHRSVNKSGSVCLCCQGVVLCWFYS